MSDNVNIEILEKAQGSLELAREHIEYWDSTTIGKTLDSLSAQVIKHIQDNNLEDLYHFSLPALDEKIIESARVMAEQSIDHFHNNNLIEQIDVY